MIFRTRAPAPPLSQFVESLWFYEGLEANHTKEKLLPNGSVELLIDLAGGPKNLYERQDLRRHVTYRNCWISGMHRSFIVIGVQNGSSMMGARFRTGGAAPFFGFPISELSGNVIELELIWKREILALRERLLEATDVEARFDLLQAFLLKKAQSRLEPDGAISAALGKLRNWPVVSLRQLASQLGLSHKQMISRFDSRVGLTPKATSRIFRFQHALLRAHQACAEIDWCDFALSCGYYDQAHLIHEFQQFAGVTPAEYVRTRTELPHYLRLD
jgi:AraC-like DNA-binding protein